MPNIENIIEAATNAIQSLTDNHKTPLHVGEAMACWTYLAFVSEIVIYEEVGLNTTQDPEFRKLCGEGLTVADSHKEKLGDFMQAEGVPLPTLPQDKPKSDPKAIPLGAKFTDSELANAISINFIVASDMCATSASQSLRTDVGLMFLSFQADKLALGFKIKELMQKKGWLKIPPFYVPPGSPEQ